MMRRTFYHSNGIAISGSSSIKTVNSFMPFGKDLLYKRFFEELSDFRRCGGDCPSHKNILSFKEAREQLKQLDKERLLDSIASKKSNLNGVFI